MTAYRLPAQFASLPHGQARSSLEARPSRFSSLAPFPESLLALSGYYSEPFMNRPAKQRATAFRTQSGLCYYCGQPMWLADPSHFATMHALSTGQARQFRCTLEHLLPRSAGGTLRLTNVVAACWCCNQRRGRLPTTESPDAFRRRVQRRCKLGKWHSNFPAGAPNNSFKPSPLRGSA